MWRGLEDHILFLMVKDNISSWCNGLGGGSSLVIRILLPDQSNLLLNILPGSKYLLPLKNVNFQHCIYTQKDTTNFNIMLLYSRFQTSKPDNSVKNNQGAESSFSLYCKALEKVIFFSFASLNHKSPSFNNSEKEAF